MQDLLDRREVEATAAARECLDREDLKAKQGSLVSKAWMVEMACLGSRGWTGSTAGMAWMGSLDLTVFQARQVLQGCQGRTESMETKGGQELKALWDRGGREGCLVQGAVQELMACMGSKVSLKGDDHVDNVDRDDHVDHDVEGESGVCAWKVAGSCSKEERLLIPPTISNSGVGGPR